MANAGPGQRQAEYGRIERFAHDPAELARKQRQEKESGERVNLILKALPDAFLYEYEEPRPAGPGWANPATSFCG